MIELKVVIIDDEPWTRDTIKRIGRWRENGFRIAGEASDGISGLECIRTLRPHLIITDMKMPGLDGAGMLKELGNDEKLPLVIVLSGYTDFAYTKQALTSRAVDYLLKPVDEKDFNKLLEQCAESIKKELLSESNQQVPSPLINGVDTVWLKEYQQERDAVKKSLESLTGSGVEKAFSNIKNLFESCDARFKLQMLIRINQDIYTIVEEESIIWKEHTDPGFSPHHLSFAIGEQKTIDDMFDHYTRIIDEFINLRVSINQKKNRIDIMPVRRYMESHYKENISLEQLAGMFSISKEYLSALFHKDFGCTFTEYLLKLRMEKAKELITEYRIPISKVPEMVGYIDVPHFYKAFKKYFSITPGKMREQGNRLIIDNEID